MLQNFPVALPSLSEQRAIIEYVDEATASIDAAIARARRQIEVVEEYRTRLIADVVTGKLDVRDAAAHLPEEADDPRPIEEGSSLVDDMDHNLNGVESPEVPALESKVTV